MNKSFQPKLIEETFLDINHELDEATDLVYQSVILLSKWKEEVMISSGRPNLESIIYRLDCIREELDTYCPEDDKVSKDCLVPEICCKIPTEEIEKMSISEDESSSSSALVNNRKNKFSS